MSPSQEQLRNVYETMAVKYTRESNNAAGPASAAKESHAQGGQLVKLSKDAALLRHQFQSETEQKARQMIEFRPAIAKIMIFNDDGSFRAKGITPDQTEHLKKQLNSPRTNTNTNNNSSSK